MERKFMFEVLAISVAGFALGILKCSLVAGLSEFRKREQAFGIPP
jgi:hypothetical protein